MKVMDYLATGLPCVASPFGLTPFAVDNENILLANSYEDWQKQIGRLINNKKLREELGKNGRNMIKDKHNINNSYNSFSKLIFSKNSIE
jgi:glycosyltransferase involved in cell wall biosynthesis